MVDVENYCYNLGCGKKFKETSNHAKACTFHSGKPYFHDAYKVIWVGGTLTKSACVPWKAKLNFVFFLLKNAFKSAIARFSNQSITSLVSINLYATDRICIIETKSFQQWFYANWNLTLKMVPDWFEGCAMAHLKAYLQRIKNLARLGAQKDVMLMFG